MPETFVNNGTDVRFAAFILFLSLAAILEILWPRRALVADRGRRWMTNFALLVVGIVLLRVCQPLVTVAAAEWVGGAGGVGGAGDGLLGLSQFPLWAELIAGLVILDATVFGLHVLMHHVPPLWRLHAVHHSDRDVDLTTALRIHPLELLFTMTGKILVILVFGIDPAAVILFEIALSGAVLVHHGNLKVPRALDAALRTVFVTPDMHRIHHSVDPAERNRNYGFCLSIWDRIFRTYQHRPKHGQTGMTVGLPSHQSPEAAGFVSAMALPFRKWPGPT